MSVKWIRISLADVDWEDETFRSSLERDLNPLRESIRSVGLLSPPWVQRKGTRFRLVSGFLRAEAWRSEGNEEMIVQVRNEKTSRPALLLLALEENRFSRGFSWAERACVLARLVRQWRAARAWVLNHAMPAMGLPGAPRVLDDHLRVSGLTDSVMRALVRRGCSLANALRVSRWSAADQQSLIPLLEHLHLGENLLREFLETIGEICRREGTSPRVFLASPECVKILTEDGRGRPERAREFRAFLRRKRYPTLVSMESNFRRARARLNLPPQISVQNAPFFEEEGVRVAFRARTVQEFRELCGRLWKSSRRQKALEALFFAADEAP